MKRFGASAPCRADLAGGTLDIWPLGLLHPGAVTVNLAIPVLVTLEVAPGAARGTVVHHVAGAGESLLRVADVAHDLTAAICFAMAPAGGVRVDVRSQAPVGSGVGGSSAYGVALVRAMAAAGGRDLPDDAVVRLVRDLEARILGVPTGTQDHWAAIHGGVMALHLDPGGERVERLAVDAEWLAARCTVFFTGIVHHSGMVNWQVIRRRLDGDEDTTRALGEIAEAAFECRAALVAGDADGVAVAIRDEWSARRRLAPEVSPPELEKLEAVVRSAGALAFKACGAGGGGSILVWHRESGRTAVLDALRVAVPGGRVLATGVELRGCQVVGPDE